MKIPFSDGKKEAALESAVRKGFIARSIDPDGIVKYTLTLAGRNRLVFEQMFGKAYG